MAGGTGHRGALHSSGGESSLNGELTVALGNSEKERATFHFVSLRCVNCPSDSEQALSTLNCILDAAPREERRKLSSAEGTCSLM